MLDYHGQEYGLTRSALSVFMHSPEEYYLQFIAQTMPRREPTQAKTVGTLVHSILLDRVDFDAAVAVFPGSCLKSDGSLNPKPAAQFREDNAGMVCLKSDKAEEVRRAVHAARLSVLGPLLSGDYHYEQPLQADVFGLQCACRPDIWGISDGKAVIYDLKVAEDDNADLFHRNAKRFKYWLQVAHYSRIVSALTGLDVEFAFFTLRTSTPYRVQRFWYGDTLSNGLVAHETAIEKFKACSSSGHWPHEYNQVLEIGPWDIGGDAPSIEGAEEMAWET